MLTVIFYSHYEAKGWSQTENKNEMAMEKTESPLQPPVVSAWVEEPCAVRVNDGEVVFGRVRTYDCGKILINSTEHFDRWLMANPDGTFVNDRGYRKEWWKTHKVKT